MGPAGTPEVIPVPARTGRQPGRWARALTLVVAAVTIPVSSAAADVGRFEVRPRAVAPGSSVELSFAAAWSQWFPVSLVPLAHAPEPYLCHGDEGLCAPATLAPPRRSPFTFLGSVHPDRRDSSGYIYRYRFSFLVPNGARPGAYAFALYCAGCYPGPRGSLIASALPSGGSNAGVLRVCPESTLWPGRSAGSPCQGVEGASGRRERRRRVVICTASAAAVARPNAAALTREGKVAASTKQKAAKP